MRLRFRCLLSVLHLEADSLDPASLQVRPDSDHDWPAIDQSAATLPQCLAWEPKAVWSKKEVKEVQLDRRTNSIADKRRDLDSPCRPHLCSAVQTLSPSVSECSHLRSVLGFGLQTARYSTQIRQDFQGS